MTEAGNPEVLVEAKRTVDDDGLLQVCGETWICATDHVSMRKEKSDQDNLDGEMWDHVDGTTKCKNIAAEELHVERENEVQMLRALNAFPRQVDQQQMG